MVRMFRLAVLMAASAPQLAVEAMSTRFGAQAPVVRVPMRVEYRAPSRQTSELMTHSLLSSWPGTKFSFAAESRGAGLTKSSNLHREVNELPIRNTRDVFYTVNVNVGTSPVSRRLIIDTGSSDLWVKRSVIGQPFADHYRGNGHALNSANVLRRHRNVFLQYGQGEVRGQDFTDRFCVSERLCVPSQSFVLATDVEDISARGYDGLLGLGYPALAAGTIGNTFLQNLAESNGFQDLAFGLLVGDEHQESYAVFGEARDLEMEVERLGLGSSESGVRVPIYGKVVQARSSVGAERLPHFVSFEEASATEANVDLQAGFWMVSVGIHAVGQRNFNTMDMAILDSGSSLIMAPQKDYMDILSAIIHGDPRETCDMEDGVLLCPCDAVVGSLTITFEDPHTKRRAPFLFSSKDLTSPTGESFFENDGIKRLCRLNVQPGPSTQWILGDVFFRRAFVVHDVKRHHVTVLPRQRSKARRPVNLVADVPGGLPAAWLAAIIGAACGIFVSVALLVSCTRSEANAEDNDESYYVRIEP